LTSQQVIFRSAGTPWHTSYVPRSLTSYINWLVGSTHLRLVILFPQSGLSFKQGLKSKHETNNSSLSDIILFK
jgi:hypothetical protein